MPDKHEVSGSTPLRPTKAYQKLNIKIKNRKAYLIFVFFRGYSSIGRALRCASERLSFIMKNIGYVYILRSLKTNNYYVGSTDDVVHRLEKHNKGLVKSTRGRCPWRLEYYQRYDSLKEARQIEFKLKRLKNKSIIERIILEKIIKLGL